MSIVFSSSEELTVEERRTLRGLLKRLTARAPGAMIDVEPEDPAGEHQFFIPMTTAYKAFDPNSLPPAEREELFRRMANPEEFVKYPEFTTTLD